MAASSSESKIFHESWYRLAGQKLSLRSSVKARRQLFRGSRWYVLHEPFGDQFFRLRPPAYEFLCRLESGRTVDEVWRESVERDPENAPGQEEVIQLLSHSTMQTFSITTFPPTARNCSSATASRSSPSAARRCAASCFSGFPSSTPTGGSRPLSPLSES